MKKQSSYNKKNEKSYKKIILISVTAFLGLVILLTTASLLYSYHSGFDLLEVVYEEQDIKQHMSPISDSEIKLVLNEDNLNGILNKYLPTEIVDFQIQSFHFDINKQRIFMNTSYKGIPLPLSFAVTTHIAEGNVIFNYNDLRWGKWHIRLPLFGNKINDYMNTFDYHSLNPSDLNLPDILEVRRIKIYESEVEIVFGMNEKALDQLLADFAQHYDPEILTLYGQSEDMDKTGVAYILINGELSNEIQGLLMIDFLEDQTFIESLLVALDDEMIEVLYNQYGEYLNTISIEKIYELKADLLIEQQINSTNSILNALEKYESSYMKVPFLKYGTTPYDLGNNKIVSVDFLVDYYKLPVTEGFVDKTKFVYNEQDGTYALAYESNNYQTIIYHKTGTEVLHRTEFEALYPEYNFSEKKLLTKEDEERLVIEASISNFWGTDKVFTRYLAADSKFAFAVSSNGYNFQNFTSFALEKKEDQWEIIEVDIKDYTKFNETYPKFNITLVPKELPDISMITRLSNNDLLKIIEDLYDRGIIENKNYGNIQYASYADRYIVVKLLDDREFIYAVSYGFLEKPYTREESLNMYNIPGIILIQD
jgi:hypothetical protein